MGPDASYKAESFAMARRLIRDGGLFVGGSAGTAGVAAERVARAPARARCARGHPPSLPPLPFELLSPWMLQRARTGPHRISADSRRAWRCGLVIDGELFPLGREFFHGHGSAPGAYPSKAREMQIGSLLA
jgi:hypothetical protein